MSERNTMVIVDDELGKRYISEEEIELKKIYSPINGNIKNQQYNYKETRKYVDWDKEDTSQTIYLIGEFTIEELEFFLKVMKGTL